MILGFSLLFTSITISDVPQMHLYVIDVGYGDAILIQLPDGDTMLIDTGKPDTASRIADQLDALGISKIDHLIITHFHKDHAGGLTTLLQRYFPASENKTVYAPFSPQDIPPDPEITQIAETLKSYHFTIIRRSDTLPFSSQVHIEVLHPQSLSGNQNEDSLVLKMVHGKVSILLAADAGPKTQRNLIDLYGKRLKSNLIKIPHHANEQELVSSFIDAVNPEIAILTIGPNAYNAPNKNILNAYENAGASLYRTDRDGTIHFVSNGKTLQRKHGKP